MNSIYTSIEAKSEIQNIYQEKLDSLSIEYKRKIVKTQFGETSVTIAGDDKKPPFILIHGSNGNSAIVIEPFITLLNDYQLVAIDVIGQPNYSSEARPSMKGEAYALWLDEVLMRLHLKDVPVYGMSFGGFIVLKALTHAPERISKAIIHAPAGVINGNPFIGIFKIFLPMKNYIKTKNEKKLSAFINQLFTEPDSFAFTFLGKVLLDLKMDFTQVPLLTKTEASKIDKKVHVIGAKLDCFFPGEKVISRLIKILPNIGHQLLLEKSKHVPNQTQNIQITNFIKKILDS